MEEIIKLIREKEEKLNEAIRLIYETDSSGVVECFGEGGYLPFFQFDNDQELIEWLKK